MTLLGSTRGRHLATLVALVCTGLAIVLYTRATAFDRRIGGRVARLRSQARGESDRVLTADDLDGLPPPVRRYLDRVLGFDDGRLPIESVHCRQRGTVRLGGDAGSWKPFEATQDVSVQPPGFLWVASIDLLPGLPVTVVDAYENGLGTLEARLLSALPVATAGPSPEVTEAELMRYLAESVWYPTALLAPSVTWHPIDDATARATIEHRETTATVEFRFDEAGLVESVHADRRYRQEIDAWAPWAGSFWDYEERNGIRIPIGAEVGWIEDDEVVPYWRATIEDLEYDLAR